MNLQIPDFSKTRVLVVGDVMLDRYWNGDTSRISPEAPVPVVRVQTTQECPGGAGNVALNVAALGAQVSVLGVIGKDESGEILSAKLEAAKVTCHFQYLAHRPTITKLRVLSLQQQLIRLDFEDDLGVFDIAAFIKQYQQCLQQADAVILSDYNKGTLSCCQQLIQYARQAGKPVLIDPKGKDFSIYAGATMLTPNYREFEAVVGPCIDETEVINNAQRLIKETQLSALLLTRGSQGMTLFQANQSEIHLPARAREVFDVTGAGDTVIAVFAATLAAKQGPVSAATLANMAGSIVVGKLGAASATVPDLQRVMLKQQALNTGVMSEEQLLVVLNDARLRGEKIVMTNGCFDILHLGHIKYLEQAKALGNRLLIAVNDDASVKRLKGESRPINTVERRMAILAALGVVDWVVPFSEDTPERLICRLLPDILVKGGDYKHDELAGSQCVIDNGGEVKILEFVDGCSTTDVINKISYKK